MRNPVGTGKVLVSMRGFSLSRVEVCENKNLVAAVFPEGVLPGITYPGFPTPLLDFLPSQPMTFLNDHCCIEFSLGTENKLREA